MEGNQLQSQAAYMRNFLFDQGYLDEQFIQLEDLQDEANPNFFEDVVKLFYADSARFIQNIELALDSRSLDFEKLDDIMHQFKGSSSSIGAKKVKKECTQFQEYCKVGNFEGCMRTFQEVKQEHAALKKKLESYFQITISIFSKGLQLALKGPLGMNTFNIIDCWTEEFVQLRTLLNGLLRYPDKDQKKAQSLYPAHMCKRSPTGPTLWAGDSFCIKVKAQLIINSSHAREKVNVKAL